MIQTRTLVKQRPAGRLSDDPTPFVGKEGSEQSSDRTVLGTETSQVRSDLAKINVIFPIDFTASMERWIEATRAAVVSTAEAIATNYPEATVKFTAVAYRDYFDDLGTRPAGRGSHDCWWTTPTPRH